MFSFTLVDTQVIGGGDSASAYLDSMKNKALSILSDRESVLTDLHAHILCEYVDSVDGGLLPFHEEQYREITALIAGYLLHCEESSRERLCSKNWTANTLMSVLRTRQRKIPGEVYVPELAA